MQVLNGLKSTLSELVSAGGHIRKTISERKAELNKFDHDLVHVDGQKGTAERITRRLKSEHDDM
jgi:hypothetical protein